MKLSRRQLLGAAAGGGLVLAGGCGQIRRIAEGPPPHLSPPNLTAEPDYAAFMRFGFGLSAQDQSPLEKGRKQWFEEQLHPTEDEPGLLSLALFRMDISHLTAYELRDIPSHRVLEQLQRAAILRAVYSPWQLRERMADFWGNHFSIFARKGLAVYRKPQDERDVVRAHCLGSFPDMLRASARSTAMLLYLDQQASNFVQPNENYARELLELHSLGLEAGYTQKDVMEAARCFTGWTEERRFLKGKGQFVFREDIHDKGTKVVMGHTIHPAGVEEGEKIIEIVAMHPATARHLSKKLCQNFLGREDDVVVKPVSDAYMASKGDIKTMLRVIFDLSEQGLAQPAIKRPFDVAVTAIRALGAETDGGSGMQTHLAKMGQPLYQWPMPDGFPVEAVAWKGSLLARWNFALDLAGGKISGTSLNQERLTGLNTKGIVGTLLGMSPDSEAVKTLASKFPQEATPIQSAALCLASSEFQWRPA